MAILENKNIKTDLRPISMWLTVNRECNFRCSWCYAKGTGYLKRDMSLELAMRLSKIARDVGVKKSLLIGGEPTLWPHTVKYNEFARTLGLRTTMVTNAFLFGTDNYWAQYKEHPCDGHGVSLKAGNSEQLKKLTGISRFDILTSGILRVNSLSPTYVSIVYGPEYKDHLLEMASYAMTCGAKGVSIDFCRGFVNNGSIDDSGTGSFTEAVQYFMRDYDELNRITGGNLGIQMSMPFCVWPAHFVQKLINNHQATSICHVIKRNGLIFDTNGDILMCNALFDFPIARLDVDFSDSNTLLDHLRKPEITGYYNRISSYPSAKCGECDWYAQCGGGCPLHWATNKPDEIVKPIRL